MNAVIKFHSLARTVLSSVWVARVAFKASSTDDVLVSSWGVATSASIVGSIAKSIESGSEIYR